MVSWFAPRMLLVLGLSVAAVATSAAALVSRLSVERSGQARVGLLRDVAKQLAEQPVYSVSRACHLVHSLTEHGIDRRISWRENWVQALLGQFYPALLRTQNPERIVVGRVGDCSERVAVLQMVYRQAHLPTRIVGLGGHVVLEVKANGKWYTADPDYDVIFGTDVRTLESGSGKWVRALLQRRGVDREQVDRYVEILHTPVDNIQMAINQPLSPRLKILEDMCGVLLFSIPLLLWGILGVFWASLPSKD
jgi:hypothetical protein